MLNADRMVGHVPQSYHPLASIVGVDGARGVGDVQPSLCNRGTRTDLRFPLLRKGSTKSQRGEDGIPGVKLNGPATVVMLLGREIDELGGADLRAQILHLPTRKIGEGVPACRVRRHTLREPRVVVKRLVLNGIVEAVHLS
jgi:hypothetical protein